MVNIPIDKVLEVYSDKDLRTFARIVDSLKSNKRTVDAAIRYLKGKPEVPLVHMSARAQNLKHIRRWGENQKKKKRFFNSLETEALRITFKTMRTLQSSGLNYSDLEHYLRRGN